MRWWANERASSVHPPIPPQSLSPLLTSRPLQITDSLPKNSSPSLCLSLLLCPASLWLMKPASQHSFSLFWAPLSRLFLGTRDAIPRPFFLLFASLPRKHHSRPCTFFSFVLYYDDSAVKRGGKCGWDCNVEIGDCWMRSGKICDVHSLNVFWAFWLIHSHILLVPIDHGLFIILQGAGNDNVIETQKGRVRLEGI